MWASLKWLRELCPCELAVEALAERLTLRGLAVERWEARGDDIALEIDVPPNRPDCLGHLGLARELAASLAAPLPRPPQGPELPGTSGLLEGVQVVVDSPEACPRYTAGLVEQVRVGPSPRWLAARLEVCGLRSINNVVDVSNWVLLELGHPVHTFDFDRLAGATIRVRYARRGEELRTLDGVRRLLDPSALVIADAQRPVALAGVMGGAETEIGPNTTRVLIEAAVFDARTVRALARTLGLRTEASLRFERGCDPEMALVAQLRTAELLREVAGGVPRRQVVDLRAGAPAPRRLLLRHARLVRLLGFDPGPEATAGALAALGLAPEPEAGAAWAVVVPSWRRDLEREADLVEEVARQLGYDRIPAELPPTAAAPLAEEPERVLEERTRERLAALGFCETIHYAMVSRGEDEPFVEPGTAPAVALANPISEALAVLRRSLLPGLLRAADFNLRRGQRDVRLFEVARVFVAREPAAAPGEPLRAALVWTGAAAPRHWSHPVPQVTLHDLIGLVEHVLDCLECGVRLERARPPCPGFHPGRAVGWRTPAGGWVAWGGQLHPELAERLELDLPLFAAELDLTAVGRLPRRPPRYRPVPRLPAVQRDLSFVIEEGREYRTVERLLAQVVPPAEVRFEVVDRYSGPPLGPGEVSLTVRVILEPADRSLTDAEIEGYRRALIDALGEQGIRLRG